MLVVETAPTNIYHKLRSQLSAFQVSLRVKMSIYELIATGGNRAKINKKKFTQSEQIEHGKFLRRPKGRRSNIALDLQFMQIFHQSEVFLNCNIHHTR